MTGPTSDYWWNDCEKKSKKRSLKKRMVSQLILEKMISETSSFNRRTDIAVGNILLFLSPYIYSPFACFLALHPLLFSQEYSLEEIGLQSGC
jgi:hypothetical protein